MKTIFAIVFLLSLAAQAQEKEELVPQLCSTMNEIVRAQRAIKKEKEIGDMTGVVDKAKLHEAGNTVVLGTKKMEALEKQYEKATGARLGFGECPDSYKAGL